MAAAPWPASSQRATDLWVHGLPGGGAVHWQHGWQWTIWLLRLLRRRRLQPLLLPLLLLPLLLLPLLLPPLLLLLPPLLGVLPLEDVAAGLVVGGLYWEGGLRQREACAPHGRPHVVQAVQ